LDAEAVPGKGGVMTGPLMLIVIGVLFLLNNLFPGRFDFGRMWPVILIVIGLVKVFEYFRANDAREQNMRNTSNGPINTTATDISNRSGSDGPDKKEGM